MFADDEARIADGIAMHLTLWAKDQGSAEGVAICWLTGIVAGNKALATGAFSAGISGIDPAGDDALVPRLIPGIVKNATFQPVGVLLIPTFTVGALLRCEMPQMLKDQHTCSMRCSELHNAAADPMRGLLIECSHLCPQAGVVLFPLCNDAGLASIAGNPSKLSLPKAVQLLAPANKAGSNHRAFDRLNGANGKMLIDVAIDGANPGVWDQSNLRLDLLRALHLPFERGM